ncbi:DUF389 domain-containing protein [Sphingomonas canadensis]|uniref:DUF389 domain-containing protein n=1 Tax=Sphingomonas canadensis TaxID=1219257 RepID=A0ABW3H393_9SPHN|nr:DUF389 domain-containing protein [Sphingomonas canadensis]MCW3834758.1 DUF389 domain-containing protein [Sphingomonas canadensis]
MPGSDAPSLRSSPWRWWRQQLTRSVDHVAVVERVRDEAGLNGRFAFMILMSAGIAVLGLLLSSPAVVIGAMLISPLMGPIIGLGFGLATFDWREIREAAVALAAGVLIAVLFCALIVLVSPIQNVTDEIAARTRPNLFDLLVALFSALAGAYAMVRGREGTIVGVAIATALMPPLAVVGFGLATANWTVFGGSLLLFFTNLMTIALAAAVMARFYGFATHLSPQHTMLQLVVACGVFLALAVPLGLSLRQIAWESVASRQAREVVSAQFSSDARLSQLEVDFARVPVRLSAVVLTPELRPGADRTISATLTRLFGRPVEARLEQYRVGTTAQAEAVQLSQARSHASEEEARLIERLAVAAGVSADAVTVDGGHRQATVNAQPLPGATIGTYRALEERAAAGAPEGWTIALVPPLATIGALSFDSAGDPAPDRIADAAWAARRRGLAVSVGGAGDGADRAAAALEAAGVPVVRGPANGAVTLSLALPEPVPPQ